MTDFTRNKTLLTMALLLGALALSPVAVFAIPFRVSLMGVYLDVRYAYALFVLCLGSAVYFFGIELISSRQVWTARRAGNILYALGLLVPPAYAALVFMGVCEYAVMAGLGRALGSPVSRWAAVVVDMALALGLGFAGVSGFALLRKRLRERERQSTVSELGGETASLMTKVNGLFEAGLYDVVVIESFRAVELALKKALVAREVYVKKAAMKDLIDAVEAHALLEGSDLALLRDIRLVRNEVTHEGKRANRDAAEKSIETARRIITAVDRGLAELDENADALNGGG